MRILMLSDVYFPRVNGVSTSIRTLREALRAKGHRTVLVAPSYGAGEAEEGRKSGVVRIPSARVPVDPEDRMMHPGSIRSRLAPWTADGFDLVHIHTPFLAHFAGIRLASRLHLATVETYHTYFEAYLQHYLPFLPPAALRAAVRGFSRRQCNAVTGVVSPSRAMASVLRRYGVRSPVRIIPTGLENRFFDGEGGTADIRGRYGIAPEHPLLLTIGRAAHEKNIDFLLRALVAVRRRAPEAVLVIAGEGPALGHLRRLARRLGLEAAVRFIGYLRRETDLTALYRAGDVFVFASRTETQGLVLLEAMAMGLPVVSTAAMGTLDILGPGKGAVVAPEDPSAFAEAVLRLLDDPGLLRRVGEEAREHARSWSSTTMADRMVDFYGSVMRSRKPAGRAAQGISMASAR